MDFLIGQRPGDLIRAFTLDGHLEDAADICSGFFVYEPYIFIIRRFFIPIYRRIGHALAAVAFGVQHRLNFTACVTGVLLTKNVEKRCKFGTFLYIAVDIVADCDKPNTVFTKNNFRMESDLKMVTP